MSVMQRVHALSDLRAHKMRSVSSLGFLRSPKTVIASSRKLKAFRPQALLGVGRMKELARRAQRRGEDDLAGAAQALSAAARPARGLWAAAGAAASGMQGLFVGKGMGQLAEASSRGVQVAAGAAAGIQGVIESMQELSTQHAASASSKQSVEAEAAALAMPIKAELAEMREALKAATDAAEAKAAATHVEVEVVDSAVPMMPSTPLTHSLASQPLQQAEPGQPQMLDPDVLQQLPNATCTETRTVAAVDAQQGLCASVDLEVSYVPQEGAALVRLVGRSSALSDPTPATAAVAAASATATGSPASQLPPAAPAAEGGRVALVPAIAAALPLQQGAGAMLWRHSVEELPGQAPVVSCELVVRVPLPVAQAEEGHASSSTNWTFSRALAGLAAVMLLYSMTSYRSIMDRHRFTKYLPKERSVLRRLETQTSASKLPPAPLQPQQPAPRALGAQIQQLSAIEAKLGAISQRLAGLQQRMETIKAEQQAE